MSFTVLDNPRNNEISDTLHIGNMFYGNMGG